MNEVNPDLSETPLERIARQNKRILELEKRLECAEKMAEALRAFDAIDKGMFRNVSLGQYTLTVKNIYQKGKEALKSYEEGRKG